MSPVKPHKILVVDDEPDVEPLIRQRMRRDVRAGRYEFVFAHNGVEALAMLQEQSDIEMVLSDINMPKMDGLTLLAQIPKVDPNLRCVIVSAYGDMENIRTAMNRGAFDFVTKPLDFEDLKVTIERTLRRVAEWREALASRDRLVVLQNELDLASKMQQSILPTRFPGGADFRIYGQMEAARAVGGDFFDIMRLDNGLLGVAIADVSDKGVPASLFMMSSRTLLKGAAVGLADPGAVLQEVNNLLNDDNQGLMFVTVLYATFDPASGAFTYANGGHNSPLLVRADGSSELLPLTGGVALGVVPDYPYAQSSMTLGLGDKLVLYTDGVTEAMNEPKEEFGVERLRAIFAGGAPEASKATIRQAVTLPDARRRARTFAELDTPQSDDVTCLVLSRGDGRRSVSAVKPRRHTNGAAAVLLAGASCRACRAAVLRRGRDDSSVPAPPQHRPARRRVARCGGVRRAAVGRPRRRMAAQVSGRVRGARILFGQSAAFSGPAQELGRNMRLGIEAAFHEANSAAASTAAGCSWYPTTTPTSRRRRLPTPST